jgi:hypothetical protein
MEIPMKSAIRAIVDKVPRLCIFDSHFVINQLIKESSDQYLSFAGRFAAGKRPTLPSHSQIGQEIKRLGGKVVEIVGPAWSENIHTKPSRCTCWKKL